jgi:tRNA dimethylallyltransferase
MGWRKRVHPLGVFSRSYHARGMPTHRPVILIIGPTAGGKTALALELARTLPGGAECICADSMQVYRGMDIGTAKPTAEQRSQVPHHLLDVAEPDDDTFSVDRWLDLADQAVADIRGRGRGRGRWPIIVGGTNLYVQAFLCGILAGPEPDPALREELQSLSADQLRSRLERADPAAAQRIHLNDRKRSIRAIEVYERSGRRISDLQTQWEPDTGGVCANESGRAEIVNGIVIVGLDYPVEAINRRINARVKAMIDAGFVDEVRGLLARNRLGRNAREALGYKQLIDHLEGRTSLEDAIEHIKIRTRRFAKQQRTWLRRFRAYPNSIWIDAAAMTADQLAETALREITVRAQATMT